MTGFDDHDLTRRTAMQGLGATVVAGLSGAASGQAVTRVRRDGLAKLEHWIVREVMDGRITGAAASVSQDGVTLWQQGFGFADVAHGQRATPFTPFGLASVTKPFTTAAIATLAAAGQVDLDAPVSRYLPFALPAPRAALDGVTLRRLGSHSSGLASFFATAAMLNRPPPPAALARAYGRLAYPPGLLYEYSNLGYLLLGAALAHVTSMRYEDAVRRLLIDPLRLTNTFFLSEASPVQRAALRYGDDGTPLPLYTTATPASGELCSSVHDLSLFAARLMGVADRGGDALSAAARAEVFAPSLRSGKAFTTFGWMGAGSGSDAIFLKNGGDPGVAARLTMLPGKRLSIAVLTNRSNDDFVAKVADELAGIFVPGWRPLREDLPPPHLSSRSPGFYHGDWRGTVSNDGVTIPVDIRLTHDGMSCRLDGREWRPWSEGAVASGIVTGRCGGALRNERAARQETLNFRLIDRGDRLTGRVLERSATSTLPYIVDVAR